MKKIVNWFKENRDVVVRNSFLLPILLVVIMSISHVVSWYDLGNPFSWAIYLSVAIEIFALASVSAASIRASKGTIWFLFSLVTAIQIIGNVFYEYKEIDLTDTGFIAWVELISPAFIDWDAIDHRRLLALIQGGTLPVMSLTSLHFYLQFNDKLDKTKKEEDEVEPSPSLEPEPQKKEIKREVEPIDENSILEEEPQNVVKVEPEVFNPVEKTKLEENLDELDKMEKPENKKRGAGYGPGISTTEKPRAKKNFGPPNLNNGSIE